MINGLPIPGMPAPTATPDGAPTGKGALVPTAPFADWLGGQAGRQPSPNAPLPHIEAAVPAIDTTAVVASSLAPPPIAIVLELHVADGGDDVRIVSAPWQLAPTGELAQSIRGGTFPQAITESFASPTPSAALPAATVAPSPKWRSKLFDLHYGSGRDVLPGATRAPDRSYDPETNAPPIADPVFPQLNATRWQERMFRWIAEHGGDPVVFLRDYRLEEPEVRAIVDAIRDYAREHGVGLRRIVCNGRELWRGEA